MARSAQGIDIPSPLGCPANPLDCLDQVVDAVGDAAGTVGGFAIDTVFDGLVTWVLRGPALLAGAIFRFVIGQDSVDLNQAWFRDGPFATFTSLSLGIMVLAMIAGAGYYVLLGQWRMVAKMLVVYPMVAILATAAVVTIADLLIDWVDVVSNDLIGGADTELQTYIDSMVGEFGSPNSDGVTNAVAGGILTVLFAVFFMIGGIVVLFTLMFRSALIYLLVAMMPIVFAAAVFPGARRFARRMIDISLTLIFSKLVIAVALSVGAAMINGGTTQGDGALEPLLKLASGGVLLLGAGIAPWYLLSVVPATGAAISGTHLGQNAARSVRHKGSELASSGGSSSRLTSTPPPAVIGGPGGGAGGGGGGGASPTGGQTASRVAGVGERPGGNGSKSSTAAAPVTSGAASSGTAGPATAAPVSTTTTKPPSEASGPPAQGPAGAERRESAASQAASERRHPDPVPVGEHRNTTAGDPGPLAGSDAPQNPSPAQPSRGGQ